MGNSGEILIIFRAPLFGLPIPLCCPSISLWVNLVTDGLPGLALAAAIAFQLATAITVLFTFALQLAVIYVPALNPIFNTTPLATPDLALCIALAALVLVAVEIEKLLVRQGRIYSRARTNTPVERALAKRDL